MMWPWGIKRNQFDRDRSVLGAGVRIRGEMESSGDMEIRGQIVGDIIHAGKLIIGEGARCDSNIQADQLVIAGEVHGRVNVRDQLTLTGTGRLYGDAYCARLVIAPGALFQGTTHMHQIEVPVTAPVRRAAPVEGPMAILSEPIADGGREPLFSLLAPPPGPDEAAPPGELLQTESRQPATAQPDAPAFYGGFSGAPGAQGIRPAVLLYTEE